MKIRWLGKACFMITASNGTIILTNPSAGMMACIQPESKIRIVTSSRGYGDDTDSGEAPAGFRFIRGPGLFSANGITVKGVETACDEFGEEKNIVYNMLIDGLSVCHCGELIKPLSHAEVDAVGRVDILCLPIGGGFTMGPGSAAAVARQLRPAVVIPMHYMARLTGQPDPCTGKVDTFVSAAQLKAATYDILDVSPATLGRRSGIAVLKHYRA